MNYVRGQVARQAHVGLPEGTVEEEYARNGFFGRVSHLYRRRPPVGWTAIDGDLRPHALTLDALPERAGGDWLASRPAFLHNADVTLRWARLTQPMAYAFRNADADEVLFVHRGGGVLESDFGAMDYREGDYLVIPRGTSYRLLPHGADDVLVIESVGEIRLPDRGLLGKHALFDPDVIEVPSPERTAPRDDRPDWELRVQHRGKITTVHYPFDPLDTAGWKGDLTIWRLNVADIRPIQSERYHLPPTAHATFVTDRVVICTFLPRGLETGDPTALKVPFYHSNIDFDEVLFYHAGDFFSRKGVGPGMITFHPQGIHHGPQPGAVEAARDKARTDEVAVMVDTRLPLELTDAARAVEDPDYWRSWSAGGAR